MLAKDIFTLNSVDRKIQSLISQLDSLIETRIAITSAASSETVTRDQATQSDSSEYVSTTTTPTPDARGDLTIPRRLQ